MAYASKKGALLADKIALSLGISDLRTLEMLLICSDICRQARSFRKTRLGSASACAVKAIIRRHVHSLSELSGSQMLVRFNDYNVTIETLAGTGDTPTFEWPV